VRFYDLYDFEINNSSDFKKCIVLKVFDDSIKNNLFSSLTRSIQWQQSKKKIAEQR